MQFPLFQPSSPYWIKYCLSEGCPTIEVQLRDARETIEHIGLHYIDMLKIDTEGCEVEMLKSLQPRLRYVGIVMFEYHSENDRRFVDRLIDGFIPFGARANSIGNGTVKYINRVLL